MTYSFAMQYGPENLVDIHGVPVPNKAFEVFLTGTQTPATLYTSATKSTQAANPGQTSDAFGNLKFFADPGTYDISTGTQTFTVVLPVSPSEPAPSSTGLQRANNLSDVANATTALSNIGGAPLAITELLKMNVQALSMAAVTEAANIPQMTAASTVIDGYTVQAGDVILLVGQGNAVHNGPWVVPASGSNCTRPVVFATGATVFSTQVRVASGAAGSLFGNSIWGLTTPTAGITVDTSSQTWNLQSQTPVSLTTTSTSTITLAPNSTNVFTGTSGVTWNLPGTAASGGTPAAPVPYPACPITIINQSQTATITIGSGYISNVLGGFNIATNVKVPPGQSVSLTYSSDFGASLLVWNVVAGATTNEPIFNVLLFGADPTGTNDSATAINNAITAAGSAGGGIVFFPPGTYKINSTITVGNATYAENTFTSLSGGTLTCGSSTAAFGSSGSVAVYTGELTATKVTFTGQSGSTLTGCTPTSLSTTSGNAVTQGFPSLQGGITLRGAGPVGPPLDGWANAIPVSLKWGGSAGGTMIKFVGPVQNCAVENLFLDATTGSTAAYCLYLQAAQGCRFNSVYANGATSAGYYITGQNGAYFFSTLLVGASDYLTFDYCGASVAPGQTFASAYQFTGDLTGNQLGSANATYITIRDSFISMPDPGTGKVSACFRFGFCDDITIRDTTVFPPGAAPSGTANIGYYDYTEANANTPFAIVIDGIRAWGSATWGQNVTGYSQSPAAPNVVRGLVSAWQQQNILLGGTIAVPSNFQNPSIFNLKWEVPGGSLNIVNRSTGYFTSGTARIIDTKNPCTLLIEENISNTWSLTMGPTTAGNTYTLKASNAGTVNNVNTYDIPAGWWVVCTYTSGDLTFSAFTRTP